MGFILTALYIAVTIISPEQFGPEWANYHALTYLAGITFLFSMPTIISGTQLRSSIQTFLMLGFILAIAFSRVANGWIGGALVSWQIFLPSAAVFFFIVANVTTIRRLEILAKVVAASCLIVVVEALCGYYLGFRADTFVLHQNLSSPDNALGQLSRLRGAGFLSDPNDFSQMLLIALPLVFIAWRKWRGTANSLTMFVPAAVLLWAIFLTHSRGALLALAILTLMIAQKRLGSIPSSLLIAALIAGMVAINFTGGRGISVGDGADRLEAWATGLEMFKKAPLFGVGFGAFTDFNEITAHNSFVLCLAELGLVGTTLWVALLVTTTSSLNKIISLWRKRQLKPASAGNVERKEDSTFVNPATDFSKSPEVDTIVTAGIDEPIEQQHEPNVPIQALHTMRLALVGFMTTSWFLSRSYSTPMYLVLGLATAMIALQRPAAKSCIRSRWLFFTLATETVALFCIYGMVHLRN